MTCQVFKTWKVRKNSRGKVSRNNKQESKYSLWSKEMLETVEEEQSEMKLNRIKATWVNGKICVRRGLPKNFLMSPMENEDNCAWGQFIAKFQHIVGSQQWSCTCCSNVCNWKSCGNVLAGNLDMLLNSLIC